MESDYKSLVGKYCSECLEDIDDCAKDGEVWSQMGGMISGNASCLDCGLTNYVEVPVFVIDRMRRAEAAISKVEDSMEKFFRGES